MVLRLLHGVIHSDSIRTRYARLHLKLRVVNTRLKI